ncbi:AbfB domain-containing protein [Streptomyces bacillaris]|uniref:AbfB domain-containing protein n=1 Tax=Streptomyces bacillaris TaxID=68179 RepID=UPI0034615465
MVGEAAGGFSEFSVPVPNARRWSPDDPFLYDLRVTLRNASGAAVDTATSCFGMRDVGKKTVDAVLRPTLNGEFACQIGTLDQGYWPDGRFFAYEQVFSNAQLNDRYTGMVRDVQRLMTTKGVSAYVYTEITDVEGEYNGLLTYDRRVQKVDTGRLRAAHGALIGASRNLNSTPNQTLGHVRSFRVTTPGYAVRYLRQADSVARTDALSTASPDLGRQDASYRTVAGLADPRCPSFESVNLPGSFLRHYDSAVYITSGDGGGRASTRHRP